MPNGLDPVAETAIRQLTETNDKSVKKTPTKRSTLIISGVSEVTSSLGALLKNCLMTVYNDMFHPAETLRSRTRAKESP